MSKPVRIDVIEEPYQAAAPAALAGVNRLFAERLGGKAIAEIIATGARGKTALGLHPAFTHVRRWAPRNAANVDGIGLDITITGQSTPTPAATNIVTQTHRTLATSNSAAPAAVEARSTVQFAWRGNAAGLGGFTMITRVAFEVVTANCRGFFGLVNDILTTGNNQVPSALLNCLCFAWDTGETTLRFQHNDGAGAATRIDLGANFPTNNPAVLYTMLIHADPNAADVSYWIQREDTGDIATGTVAADLPANTQFLNPKLYMNNGNTAGAVAFAFAGAYFETAL